jgi:succinate dehydrogenase / fumarate reductase iron-sulfur subunit
MQKKKKNAKKVHVCIFRFNPENDFFPNTHSFFVSLQRKETILELLERIKAKQDGSLTFRSNCGRGICKSCKIKVNGKQVLGCKERVQNHVNEHNTIHIAPSNENVLKDLVVKEDLLSKK